VAIGLPLLAIRTAYALVFQVTGDMTWNSVKGDSTAYLVMTFLTETGIIYASVWTIFNIGPPPRKKEEETEGDGQGYGMVDSERGSRESHPEHSRIEREPIR
jgi:hypothetical protein